MKSIFQLYKLLNILSLDVAAGAVICAAFFADLFAVTILPQGLAALGLAVWMIYTVDHLLDAKRLGHTASTTRHQFHHDYFRLLSVCVFVVFCVEIVLIFFLREQIFRSGLILSFTVLLYILINRWLKYAKEIAGALLYCCGVLLPVLSLKFQSFDFESVMILLPYVLIVLTNLILFSWIDYQQDLNDGQHSVITLLGKDRGKVILAVLFVCVAIAVVFSFRILPISVVFIYVLMASVLFYVFLKPDFFTRFDRYRYFGDGIFLLPLLHWLV